MRSNSNVIGPGKNDIRSSGFGISQALLMIIQL
jgi:hypothetical protein